MPISQEAKNSIVSPGYPTVRTDASKAVYALYPSNKEGKPIVLDGQVPNGSAFAVSEDGLFLTATHVIDAIHDALSSSNINYNLSLACNPGPFIDSHIMGVEDIILMESPNDIDISLLNSQEPPRNHLEVRTGGTIDSPGQPISTFGYPLLERSDDYGWALNQRTFGGVVSSMRMGFESFPPTYEVDALFNPGLSGGPLLSLSKFDVIGVVRETKWHQQNINGIMIPYPTNISRASITGDLQDDHPETIGSDLEEYGIDFVKHSDD